MILPSATTLKLAIGIACALAVALLAHDRNRWKSAAALRGQQVIAERSAHSATVANFRAAAALARQADAANAERVRAEQASINERTANDYQSRIAAARTAAQRLREAATAAADPRGARAAPVPALPAAPRGAAEAPGEDGFPPSDRLIATEQAIQLDALIAWAKAQAAVEP